MKETESGRFQCWSSKRSQALQIIAKLILLLWLYISKSPCEANFRSPNVVTLVRMVPQSPCLVPSWGPAWEGLEDVALLEEVWWYAFRFPKPV